MKKLFLITFLAVFMLSCTDKKYDFENMSEDVHLFDNGVYFPLLTTDVPFSRMIEGYEDNIGLQADGIYFIHSNPGNVAIKEEIYTTGDVLTDQSEISFSGIPDFLCDDNVNINLANPAFLARIENNGNVYPFWADIALTPLYNDGTRGQKINIQRINFEDAGIMNIYIAKERIPRIESMGYTLVECPEMNNIFHKIPQKILVDVTASSPITGMSGTIDMHISYNLDLPLSVERGTTLKYVTQEDGLSDIFDVVAVSELTLIANCINYYPMDIELDARPYDAEGNPITDIEVTVEGVVRSSLTNEPVADIQPSRSTIYIKLNELTPGRITDIDGFDLDLNASFPASGSMTKWENIIINLVADAPSGVDIITD